MTDLLLAEQAWWDTYQFDPQAGYTQLDKRDAKANHIMLHIAKAAGKLIEKGDDVIINEVIPDTAIYRSQLAYSFRLNTTLMENFEPLELEPDEANGLFYIITHAAHTDFTIANGRLAEYLEPRYHGESSGMEPVQEAADKLHIIAARLALVYELDLASAHRTRMEQLLGKPIPNL